MQIIVKDSVKTIKCELPFCTTLLGALPPRYTYAYGKLSEKEKHSLTERRIRKDGVCSFTCGSKNIPMRDESGGPLCSFRAEIEEILDSLCDGSVYSYTSQIKEGYIPYRGTRIGVGGVGAYRDGVYDGLLEITSLCIRIPLYITNAADKVLSYIRERGLENTMGIIAVSPPNMGKTTFLRALARGLSSSDGFGKRVCITDERCELKNAEMTENCYCDVLSAIPKTDALEMAIRSLSPEIIVFDEIGSSREAQLLERAFSGGIYVAASVHGNCIADIARLEGMKEAVRRGIFRTMYLLKGANSGYDGEIIDLSGVRL